MGFLNSSCSFSRFQIIDPVDNVLIMAIPDKLLQFAFRDIEDMPVMQAHGWTSFEDMFDDKWEASTPMVGQYAVFSLRLDTRRIPAGVIKKHVTLAVKEEKEKLAAVGKKFISRDRLKELKEQIILKLRQHFLPVPAEFNVLWDLQGSQVWLASTQGKVIDLFMEYFLTTFELHLEQLTPYALAVQLLGENAQDSLNALQATQFIAEGSSNE